MNYIQIQIGSMPILIAFISDATIAFSPTQKFKAIIDDNGAIFDDEGFSLYEEDFNYNVAYEYKTIPNMLQWVLLQNLTNPFDAS